MTIRSLVALVAVSLVLLSGCESNGVPPDQAQRTEPEGTPIRSTPTKEPLDPCASFPPPLRPSYLPRRFNYESLPGSGLFQGTTTPSSDFIAWWAGPQMPTHINLATQDVPYLPGRFSLVEILEKRGRFGRVEGGFSIDFTFRGCDFRLLSYGVPKAEFMKVISGIRPSSGSHCEPLPARKTHQVVVFLLPEGEAPYEPSSFVPRMRQLAGEQINYPIRATLKYLLAGPTSSEHALGCGGIEDMTGVIRSLQLSDGLLTIDFHDISQEHGWISTSNGSGVFQGQFALTLAQFEEIDRVLFEIEGSCETFYKFVQTGVCKPTDLARWR